MIASLNPARLFLKPVTQERKDPVHTLPREIFYLLFDYMKAPEVYMASQVSKRWHAVLKTNDQLWNRCAAELGVNGQFSQANHQQVARMMTKDIQGVSSVIFTNDQLEQRIVRYFRRLPSDASGKVICRFGHGKKDLIFRVSACFIFKKLPDLVLGMPSGTLLDKLHQFPDNKDQVCKALKFQKMGSNDVTELRVKLKGHWVQIQFPKELEAVFLERFKNIAARLLISLNRRSWWDDHIGILVTGPYHMIKYNDILGEVTQFK